MGLAEKLAEVEPFKTTFLVGVWNRSWPFVTFWSVLMLASAFFERPFCKYLCPLGAALVQLPRSVGGASSASRVRTVQGMPGRLRIAGD